MLEKRLKMIPKKEYLLSASLLLLSTLAMANNHGSFQAARQIQSNEAASYSPVFALKTGNEKALEKAYHTYLKTGKAPKIITEGFVVFPFGAQQPIVPASPFELSVISLEEGERVSSVSSGDPLRWSYSLNYSGQREKHQAHVLLKPSEANISTDLVITTDKRLYTLKLVSEESPHYYRDVRFWYPSDIQKKIKEIEEKNEADVVSDSNSFDASQLHFNYQIKGPFFRANPRWTPVRIFDDGEKTYIQFPHTIDRTDLPALFIENNGQRQLVNYRINKPYFVIDRIFKRALLLSGTGRSQETLTLINQDS